MKSPSLFLSESFRAFHTTGAIFPSGRALARALTAPLDEMTSPRTILEAGPGTGAVSEALIKQLQPEDHLTLCEINPAFVAHLEERLGTDPRWIEKKDSIHIVQADVVEVAKEGGFDLVVSGLPLNNFSPDFVGDLLDGFLQGLKPGGVHTFFEYRAVRRLRMRVGSRKTRDRMRSIDEAVSGKLNSTLWDRVPVFANVPPAWVYRVRASGGSE